MSKGLDDATRSRPELIGDKLYECRFLINEKKKKHVEGNNRINGLKWTGRTILRRSMFAKFLYGHTLAHAQ